MANTTLKRVVMKSTSIVRVGRDYDGIRPGGASRGRKSGGKANVRGSACRIGAARDLASLETVWHDLKYGHSAGNRKCSRHAAGTAAEKPVAVVAGSRCARGGGLPGANGHKAGVVAASRLASRAKPCRPCWNTSPANYGRSLRRSLSAPCEAFRWTAEPAFPTGLRMSSSKVGRGILPSRRRASARGHQNKHSMDVCPWSARRSLGAGPTRARQSVPLQPFLHNGSPGRSSYRRISRSTACWVSYGSC